MTAIPGEGDLAVASFQTLAVQLLEGENGRADSQAFDGLPVLSGDRDTDDLRVRVDEKGNLFVFIGTKSGARISACRLRGRRLTEASHHFRESRPDEKRTGSLPSDEQSGGVLTEHTRCQEDYKCPDRDETLHSKTILDIHCDFF